MCAGNANAKHCASLVAWDELAHGREVSQPLPANSGRHRKRTQLAGPDLFNSQGCAGEEDLHLSANQVRQCGPTAPIGHVNHVDARHHLEQLAGHVARSCDARRGHVEFARIGLGVSN